MSTLLLVDNSKKKIIASELNHFIIHQAVIPGDLFVMVGVPKSPWQEVSPGINCGFAQPCLRCYANTDIVSSNCLGRRGELWVGREDRRRRS